MKKITLLTVLLLLAIFSFSDYHITRGPTVGEIYFVGPTYTGLALYRSTDFGQSIICMDSINSEDMMAITAGKTQGIIYYTTMQGSLYFSDNFGADNSWIFRHSGIGIPLCNSDNIGFIFEHAAAHSEDFGNNFIIHTGNGAFGLFKEAEKGFADNGYFLSYKDDVLDSVYLFTTTNNFNDVELINTINIQINNVIDLTRCNNLGEIFLANLSSKQIYYSSDYGHSFIYTNYFNLENDYSLEVIGGRQDGELYLLYNFVNMMWQNAHIYIYHSTDYGVTFEVFHPFSKGQKPLFANFSAKTEDKEIFDLNNYDSIYYVTGDMPLSVQFYNYSIGDINLYEWDFNNDGLIDSNEENPTFTFSDTGWYSVSLTIYNGIDTNSFLRENYVYVYKLTNVDKIYSNPLDISFYPNPFTDKIYFSFPNNSLFDKNEIVIYDLNGKTVNKLSSFNNEIVWDGSNYSGEKCESGVYLVNYINQQITKKIILTN